MMCFQFKPADHCRTQAALFSPHDSGRNPRLIKRRNQFLSVSIRAVVTTMINSNVHGQLHAQPDPSAQSAPADSLPRDRFGTMID